MRSIPAALQAHLAGTATTTAQCWRLTRTDGVVLGFTDHDETIRFDGTDFEAATGLTASEAETSLGLSAGTQEVEGALSSLAIEEADILDGRYDGARVEVFLVNWQAPEQRLAIDAGELGEVKRGDQAFTAELRGIASRLDRQRGRLYRRRCDAVLGDARCRVDLSAPGRFADTVVVQVSGGGLVVEAVGGDLKLFAEGHLAWQGGAAAGLKAEVAGAQSGMDGRVRLSLIGTVPAGVLPEDPLRLFAGCDKSFATCKGRFANALNFRGFPHLPGSDVAMGYARQDGQHDGAPVVA